MPARNIFSSASPEFLVALVATTDGNAAGLFDIAALTLAFRSSI